jgi:PAS domain S-box-containing protein
MKSVSSEEARLRNAALKNAESVLLARRRAEEELLAAKEALEHKTRELQKSEERFRAAFGHAAVGIGMSNLEGRFLEVNQKLCDIVGYSAEELRQLTFVELTHPDDLQETEDKVRRLLAGAILNYALEKRYVRKDGRAVWCRATVTLLRTASGEPESFVGVVEDIDARVQAEETSLAAAERLQLALAAGDLGDWSWDAKTDLLTLGARAAEIFGFSTDEPLTWTQLRKHLDADDRMTDRVAASQALVNGADYRSEFRLVQPSGRRCAIASRGRGIYAEDGTPKMMIGVVQDISERKAAEDVHAHLSALVSSSEDAIISKTLGGIITSWNRGAQRMFGYSAEETVGKPITMLIPEDHRSEEPIILERVGRGEPIEHYETVRIKKDGTRFDVSLSVSPIRGPSGEIIGASKIARNITRQKQTEAALREETRVLELLNVTGQSIAAQLDLEGLVQSVTDAATALSGAKYGAFFYNILDAAGESYVLFALSGAPRSAFERFGLPRNTPVFDATFRGEGVVRSADITADPRYGKMSPHYGMPKGHLPVRSYLAVPVMSRTEEVIGGLFFGHPEPDVFTERSERLVLGVAAQAGVAIDNARLFEAAQREIANRERAEAALRETDRRKDEFLATLAHELRNPLAPIRQAALISRSSAATEAQKRWGHEVINRQVQQMALLLDDLLDISRITRGTLELRREMTDLATVVGAAVETARPSIDAKRHVFSVELPSERVLFAADPLRVSQILSNLLTNAAKYTDPGGRIQLRATREGGSITISVADSGIGIPPDALAEVFAMFSQVKTGQDRSEGGLGIGLALSKGLVSLHGGTIDVKSAGPGKGSEFIVRLPLEELDASPKVETAAAERKPPVKRRVLIADDNRAAAESLAMLLQMEGHDVQVTYDGQQALETFIAMQPEIALLDIGMPKTNGYDVARQMRESASGREVTLVAVTGWGQDSDRAKAAAAGFDYHFTKPVDVDRLIELVRSPADYASGPAAKE